ncbi:hypothetical protein BHM03_00006823, partial [Ensete ventricosum]
ASPNVIENCRGGCECDPRADVAKLTSRASTILNSGWIDDFCTTPRLKTRRKRRRAMAKLSKGLFVLSFLFVLLASVPVSLSSQKKASSAARREDIPYIKCQVCEKVAHQIYHQVMDKEAQVSPKKVGILNPRSVSEFQIIEIAENICNLKKEQADWMLQIDIVEKGDRLQVCKQLVDLIPLIYVLCSNLYLRSDWLTPDIVLTYSSLLNKGSKGCATRNVRPLNVLAKRSYFNDRLPGDPFLAKPSKEAEMEKMLRSMEGIPGAPSMKMYSREDLMKNNFGDEQSDDDDDDDDDDDNFPAKLVTFTFLKSFSKFLQLLSCLFCSSRVRL